MVWFALGLRAYPKIRRVQAGLDLSGPSETYLRTRGPAFWDGL